MIKAAVFDVDGTLLDSMPIWMDAGERYLQILGIEPDPSVAEKIWDMSIAECSAYLKERYHLPLSVQEIYDGIIRMVQDFYFYEAPLKPGVKEFLEELKQKGIPMVIATSSDRSYLKAAFERTGIAEYFDRIFTCAEAGAGKTNPLIYEKAAEYLGVPPEEIWVFEDVIHAVRSAKQAHFHVAGLEDAASVKDREAIRNECDVYLKDFTEADRFWKKVEGMDKN